MELTATDVNSRACDCLAIDGNQQLSLGLLQKIERSGQTSVLRFWSELSANEQGDFARQLARVDWDNAVRWRSQDSQVSDCRKVAIERAKPPTCCIRLPKTSAEYTDWIAARKRGEALLRAGQLGVVLVAGGLATRLGGAQPKGMYPIGPVSGCSLFQLFAEQVLSLNRRYRVSIPYMIMTSDSTHNETVNWFAQHDWFGLKSTDVFLFRQGRMPAIDAATGELLLASKSSLVLNPDGHGGVLSALSNSGLFVEMQRRGIETLFYHQVDNPLVHICDPAFLGFHARSAAEVSTKVVSKLSPQEKVGVVVEINGRIEIIEYSDLPSLLASSREPNGQLRFVAGNTAIHLFQRAFLERVAAHGNALPWHRVVRRNSFVDSHGRVVHPTQPNAVKFERFVFDILPLADAALVVETQREREFAPLKCSDGEFSPSEVRRAMVTVASARLRAAGIEIPNDVAVEISPLAAAPDEQLTLRSDCPRRVDGPIVFCTDHFVPGGISPSASASQEY